MNFDDPLASLVELKKPSVLVSEGCNLYWSSLNVTGPENKPTTFKEKYLTSKPKKVKQILHNVSGIAEAGKLLAIMGSSGAGKTTLLNVLTSRNLKNLDVQGTILMDGHRTNKWKIREVSAFVQQHDMFVGTLTAREHLRFMAKLRMGNQYTLKQKYDRVESVIKQMGLTNCANTPIGIPNSVKGLSCGEMKRLAFASEILTCPKILFCDEPTSGLDAFMAGHVVQALRSLADGGMTIIITIHQPSSQVYGLFHNLCLMACGRTIYLGPVEEAVPLFSRCGFPCPPYYNPADHLIRTLAVINRDRENSLKNIAKIRDGFLKSSHGQVIAEIGKADRQSTSSYSDDSLFGSDKSFFSQEYAAGYFDQLMALGWRSWLTIIRDPVLLQVQLFHIIIAGLITGAVYFNTQITPETIISINGIMFNHIRNVNFMLQFLSVPIIIDEMPIVLKENANGAYRISTYFIAKNIAELPQYIVLSFIYNLIVYWMTGLYPAILPFLFSSFVSIMLLNVAISVSYAVATIFGDVAIAITMLSVFVIPIMAFGGFFIAFATIPVYFGWLSALSYFKYAYEAFAINQWENIPVMPGCLNATSKALTSCPKTGLEVIESIDFSPDNKWFDMVVMFVMSIVLRLISYMALLLRKHIIRVKALSSGVDLVGH
ncbi:hypothetical protein WR25_07524 [Diploscapter pachys]|uniref:ABC transporter domain-containing protein n=1 Tax=Diploscapter pachys TaxID=2018661 RepID=A0A2A2JK78_9BILA|nr:hypothetical protein WR25_07524 [Diploscapter pachys]